MPTFLLPFASSSLLLWVIFITCAGIGVAIQTKRNPYQKQLTGLLTTIILLIIVTNGLLYILPGPIKARYVREIISLGSIFFSIGMLALLRTLPKRLSVMIITLFILAGASLEFNEFIKYERLITIDWGHYKFMQWLDTAVPRDAIILSDPFTMRTMVANVPFIQSPKEDIKIRQKIGLGLDPRSAIFSGDPSQIRIAFSLLCPEYIVIDRITTQQFYPLSLQDNPTRWPDLMQVVYNERTPKSVITVFKLLPTTCTPLPITIHSPT